MEQPDFILKNQTNVWIEGFKPDAYHTLCSHHFYAA